MDGVDVEVNGQKLKCYKNGDVWRLLKNGEYRLVDNSKNHNGYNTIKCGRPMFMRQRIILYAFTDFDISNLKLQVDHIDGNKLNNCFENLRVVTHQENQHNRSTAKGYAWYKKQNKWVAYIKQNSIRYHLGYYNTRWEARQAYLNAIPIYHPTAPHHLYLNEEDDQP